MIAQALHPVFLFAVAISQPLDVSTIFAYLTSATAFLFILVTVLIFVYIYDNMRRSKRTTQAEA